jgi:hypothetical protein
MEARHQLEQRNFMDIRTTEARSNLSISLRLAADDEREAQYGQNADMLVGRNVTPLQLARDDPWKGGAKARVSPPSPGREILLTSAPRSPRCMVQ